MKLQNHSLIKQINRARILDTIRKEKLIARSQIADITGLDRKSITNFVTELLQDGLIEEAGKQDNVSGRPFVMLRFKEFYSVGIYIAPHFCRGVKINLYGEVVKSAEYEYKLDAELDEIVKAVKYIYSELNDNESSILGVGICIPGIMDLENDIIIESVNIPSFNGLNFRKLFSGFIKQPLFFEEESRANALAEKWFGTGRKYNDFVCIEVSGGIGAGIVNDRRLFKGAGQYAGEVGHVVIVPDGQKCRCGNHGCLEAYASERAVIEQINQLIKSPISRLCYFSPDKISSGQYEKLTEETGERLGTGLAAMVNILCPKVIILSGAVIAEFGEPILPYIREAMKKSCLKGSFNNTEILISELRCGDALGAATLPLAELFEVPGYYYV